MTNRYDVRLGERFGYQSVAIWGNDLPDAIAKAVEQQKEPLKMGFTAEDVISVSLYRTITEDEKSAIEEEAEIEALLGE